MNASTKSNRQIFLTTPDLDLVLIEKNDALQILKWFRDPEVNQFLNGGELPITLEYEENYISNMYKMEKKLQLGIYHRQDQDLIGTAGIHEINNTHLQGNFGIAIGNKEYWGRGYGTQTLTALLNWAFNQRGLRGITLTVLGNNPRARQCYENCGFRLVGSIPESVFKQGQWFDRHIMYIKSPFHTLK